MSKNLETRLNELEERVKRFKLVLIHRSSKESIEDARARYERLHGCSPALVITYRTIG
ncbi:hypothetical protein SAMN05216326_12934 [Nitrosomonas marina]|uniref:Uncharacterized protein n=1 Tax=Nitrosomonas marina TaxID=917 RepID=A0A1I0EPL2_9PROT|nr:hypothetical protein [Nitrosomonas marina]SET47202.1 hypothetical protein SAMN05216326_12934 [Nitrosomonas marina]